MFVVWMGLTGLDVVIADAGGDLNVYSGECCGTEGGCCGGNRVEGDLNEWAGEFFWLVWSACSC